MNLTDLREVLDEHSATEHADLRAQSVLGGVHHRIKVRARRRRVAAVAAATLAVLAVGVGTLTVSRAPDPSPSVPTASVRMIDGFPEYASGARLIAAKSARPPARSVTLSFVPTSTALTFFERCDPNSVAEHVVTLNGKQLMRGTGSCNSSSSFSSPAVFAKEWRIKVGSPATLTMTMSGTPTGEFGVAVGAAVDVSVYPFPPRPATLEPLGEHSGNPTAVRADPADPQRVVSRTFRWRTDRGRMSLSANTPGALTVRLNGVQVYSGQWWTYNIGGAGGPEPADLPALGLKLSPGQLVTMTVTPERMTGDWVVAFYS